MEYFKKFESRELEYIRVEHANAPTAQRPYVSVCRHVRAVKKLPYSDRSAAVTCKPSGRHCCILWPSPPSSILSKTRHS